MTNIGPAASHIGCPEMAGGPGAYPVPVSHREAGAYPGAAGGGFADAFGSTFAAPAPAAAMNPERFVSSSQGGVIVGADGNPAGRVPAGSFIDTKTGTVFGADGKAIELPTGASVDFFDLPSLAELRGDATTVPATISGGGAFDPPMKTAIGGRWGGGAFDPPMKTGVGGAWGPGQGGPRFGDHHFPAWMPQQHGPVMAGGATGSVAGARGIGTPATLEASVAELIETLRALTAAMAKTAAANTAATTTAATTTAGGAGSTTTTTPSTTTTSTSSSSNDSGTTTLA